MVKDDHEARNNQITKKQSINTILFVISWKSDYSHLRLPERLRLLHASCGTQSVTCV